MANTGAAFHRSRALLGRKSVPRHLLIGFIRGEGGML
jgi:hypothetical protein